MRILKPLRIGCITRTMPAASGHQVVVTGQICWDLLDADVLHTDQKMWEMVGVELGGGALDGWMPKLCGEFLVSGKAVALSGGGACMEVRASVGDMEKRLAVYGDRFWNPGVLRVHASEPKPFLEMPISYGRAFGGVGFLANPVGVGYRAARGVDRGERVPLPNFEYPNRPLLHQADELVPASMGPIDLAWLGVLDAAGTYDKTWFKQRYPLPPSDFDWRVYNVAPLDQQLGEGFFVGDEAVCIDGMHAVRREIRSHLPGMSLRLFVARVGVDGLSEISTRLDTVWLFPSALAGVILYRAVIDCVDADARDIEAIMLAGERLNESRPSAYYEDVYRLRTDESTKAHYVLADDQLMPTLRAELERELDARRMQVRRQRREKWQAEGGLFKSMSGALTGIAVPSAASDYMLSGEGAWLEDLLPIVLPEDVARGNVDLAGIQRSADVLRQRGRDMRAAASDLVPFALRDVMGFSREEQAQGAIQGKEQVIDLLGLGGVQATFASQAADLRALLGRLNADSQLHAGQELSSLMEKAKGDEFEKMRALIQDPKLLDFFNESEALRKALSPSTMLGQELPEVRIGLLNLIREMAEGFEGGVLAPPSVASPMVAVLEALGVDVDPIGMEKWPPGKMGAVVSAKMRRAIEEDGLVGMVQLAGKLQLASLSALPADKRAQLKPVLEQQTEDALCGVLAYKLAYPESDKLFSDAFSNAPASRGAGEYDHADAMEQLRSVAGDVSDHDLRVRVLNFIEQSEEMAGGALLRAFPQYEKDGKADLKRYQQDGAAQALMLADYRLPADDALVEGDWLTYDKRFAIALATAAISRLGLPLTATGAAPAVATDLFDLVQRGEKMMRDGRAKSPVALSQVGDHEAEVGVHLGAWIVAAHRQGISLAGRDLAGADLRGADLRGTDLTGAFLERADLSDARLDGARCNGIVLSSATLARASFRGASLCKANLGGVNANRADFSAADLSDAQLYQADLSGADCTDAVLDRVAGIRCILRGLIACGSHCEAAQFIESDLVGIKLDRACWQKTVFMKSEMAGFSACAARLEECVWAQVDLSNGDLQDAQLHGAQFNECNCDGFNADGIQAAGACWIKGSMQGANFSLAILDNALFESVPLEGSDFWRAKMNNVTFMRAVLRSARLSEAQLMQAHFHNADLSDADLRLANLHGADFSDANLDRADLTGARRLETLLEIPRANSVD